MPTYYYERVNNMLAFSRRYGFPKDGDRFLEVGTGWLHWEAITSRLFFDLEAVLVDIWDNRQLTGINNYLSQLDLLLDQLQVDEQQLIRAHRLISEISKVQSFQDLYSLLGFDYLLDQDGRLSQLKTSSFDVVVSAGVLEHVHADAVGELINSIARVLKPGGYSYHRINLRDHLYFYDKTTSTKQYLCYSDRKWKRYFENHLQYFNRIQLPRWLEFFSNNGLVLIHKDVEEVFLSGLKIADEFNDYDQTILNCGGLTLIHQKPIQT